MWAPAALLQREDATCRHPGLTRLSWQVDHLLRPPTARDMIICPACKCRQDSRSRWHLAEGPSAVADDLEYRTYIMVFELEGEFPIAGNASALKEAWVRLQRRYHE